MKKLRLSVLLLLVTLMLPACGGTTPAEPAATATSGQPATGATAPGVTTATAPVAVTDAPTGEPATETVPTPTPTAAPAVLCAELGRPALILSTGPGFEGYDPRTGARCPLPLPETTGYLQTGGERLYFVAFDSEAGTNVVSRLNADRSVEPLEPTRATGDVYYLLRFTVAANEGRLAWSRMATQADASATALLGSLWIGAADGSEATAVFENQMGGESRIVAPIRFTADGAMLYYTWEPIGLGGAWNAFNGRYDNIYRVPVAGGAPEKVFDCADAGLFLCAGDFLDDGTVTYIDIDRTIHIVGLDGTPLAAIPTTGDYAGYPTFSPSGDLYYSEAVLSGDTLSLPLPAPGTVYTLASPYTGVPAVVASADGLLTSAGARPFLDAEHLVVGYEADEMWGTALLSTAGEIAPLEPWPNAYLATVWPGQ